MKKMKRGIKVTANVKAGGVVFQHNRARTPRVEV